MSLIKLCVHSKYMDLNFFLFTWQNFAPYLGGGLSHTRYRFLVPPAQVVEHGVQSLHGPHPPISDSVV